MLEKQPTRRDRLSAQKKMLIYEKAKALFLLYGYEKTTMADISKATGMSTGSIYHFYEGKEEILLEICAYIDNMQVFGEQIEVKALRPQRSTLELCEAYVREWEKLGVDITASVFKLLDRSGLEEEGSKALASELALLFAYARQKNRMQGGKDVKELAEQVFLLLHGLIYDWCLRKGAYDLTQKTTQFMMQALPAFIVENNRFENMKKQQQNTE
ncbi:MAG: TetR/AcrR family transcriptional regulator [Christensenellaceae bacterium]|jgi:TetR/AcrR family fatty acid metabolism transcriptional regulator